VLEERTIKDKETAMAKTDKEKTHASDFSTALNSEFRSFR